MIHKVALKHDPCDLPKLSLGDYVIVTIPEVNTEITVQMGAARFTGCDGCPINKIREDDHHVAFTCNSNLGGLICSGGDFYPADITDILEEI